MIELFELCSKDRDHIFSPFAWRVRLCLLHKGLGFKSHPVTFLEKDGFKASGSKTVPVLCDNGRWVSDSFDIACYLERTYPEKPVFGSAIAMGQARLVNQYVGAQIVGPIFPMIVGDIIKCFDDDCRDYFRTSREAFLGCSLEDAQKAAREKLSDFRAGLVAVRSSLKYQPFLSGDSAAWADYAVFAAFVWAHLTSPYALLETDDPINKWLAKMRDLFDGHAACFTPWYEKT